MRNLLSTGALALVLAVARPASADEAPRRAADERLLSSPTELTLPALHVAVTDDELLLVRLAVGLTDHLQLDLWAGGFPVAGAGVLPIHGLIGGAAGGVFGFVDLGLKYRLVDEGAVVPGLAVSYDLLDAFGVGVGVAGAVAGGGVGAGAAVAGANAQFNLLSLVAGKHFGGTHLTLGGRLLDNHHFLPQSARFAVGGTTGGTAAGATDGTSIAEVPTRFFGFVGVEQVLGPRLSLMGELYPGLSKTTTSGTLGARWQLGFDEPFLFLPLDRLKFRLDLGAHLFDVVDQSGKDVGLGLFPWAGVGFYVI